MKKAWATSSLSLRPLPAVSLASMMLATGAAAQEALPTIDVVGAQGGYQTVNPGLTRLPVPLRDVPQTVNVVPEKVIQEQNSSTVREALRNVSGITFRAGEGGNQGDTPYIRGFQANNDIYRDGVRDPGWYTRDNFTIDSVEVYKGPSSVLFGRGSAGGVINLNTKTPVDRTFVEGTVTGNTAPGYRATLDANGKVNEQVSARIQVMGQQYDIAGRDHVEENRYGFAPSVKIKLGDRTTATFSHIFQKENSIPDYGIPFLSARWGVPRSVAPVPRNTWYGILGPDPDTDNVTANISTARIEHDITNDLKVTNTTRYSHVDRFQRNVFPEPNASVPNPPNLNANWTPNRAQISLVNTNLTNQTDFNARFVTGTWQHHATFGFDVTRETRDFQRNAYAGLAPTNFINPDPYRFGGTLVNPTASQLSFGQLENVGVYVADQVKLNQYFELLGSVRFDQLHFSQDAPLAAASVRNISQNDGFTSWRLGAVAHPTPFSSVYVMRGVSFNPSADTLSINVGTNAAGNANALSLASLGPEKNETTEVGGKVDVLNGRLSLASAIFQTEKTNQRITDPATSSFTVLQGVVRVRGFEASAVGNITDQWAVIASYTYLNARIASTIIPTQRNNEPVITPAHTFSFWSTYDLTPELQVGGGAFYVGESYGDLPNTAQIPSYWRFDAMAAYKFNRNVTLQLNLYNLTDKYYFASGYSNWAVPGQSRTAALTLRVKY